LSPGKTNPRRREKLHGRDFPTTHHTHRNISDRRRTQRGCSRAGRVVGYALTDPILTSPQGSKATNPPAIQNPKTKIPMVTQTVGSQDLYTYTGEGVHYGGGRTLKKSGMRTRNPWAARASQKRCWLVDARPKMSYTYGGGALPNAPCDGGGIRSMVKETLYCKN